MKFGSVAAGIAGLLVLAGLLLGVFNGAGSESLYLTAPVERGDLVTTITATGTLQAVVTVKVGSQLSGQIARLLVDFDDRVAEGQPLAELDPRTLEAKVREARAALEVAHAQVRIQAAAVQRAEAELATARSQLAVAQSRSASARALADDAVRERERTRTLLERDTVARSTVDRARAGAESASALLGAAEAEQQVQQAAIQAAEASLAMAAADLQNARAMVRQRQAALDQAEVDLSRTVIRAPIDGVVVGRDIEPGQTVAAALEAPTLFTIAQDLRDMEVHAKVDEADIGRIEVGQSVAFTVDAHPGRVFDGAVVQIRKAPEVVQNVVTYTVVIAADNSDLLLLPGMTAIVRIVVEKIEHVLKLPNAALRFRPPADLPVRGAIAGEPPMKGVPAVVWREAADGAATPLQVGLGTSDAAASELVAGPLAEGDRVIVGIAPAAERGWLSGLRLGL